MTNDMTLNKSRLDNTASEKPFILSRDPNTAMQEMMHTIDALRSIYLEENEALEQSDTHRFISLQDRKLAAARNYQLGARQILERRAELKKIDPALKQNLAQMQEEFSEITAKNMTALGRISKAVERLNERIMQLARETVSKDGVNYSASGSLENGQRPLSIGLNESA